MAEFNQEDLVLALFQPYSLSRSQKPVRTDPFGCHGLILDAVPIPIQAYSCPIAVWAYSTACTGLSLVQLLTGRCQCESLGLRTGQGWQFEGVWTESGSVGWTVCIYVLLLAVWGRHGVGSEWWRLWARLALLSYGVSSLVFPSVQPRLADFIFTRVLLSV